MSVKLIGKECKVKKVLFKDGALYKLHGKIYLGFQSPDCGYLICLDDMNFLNDTGSLSYYEDLRETWGGIVQLPKGTKIEFTSEV